MRDRHAIAFFVAGSCCIVAGGLVAAATTPLRWSDGPWLAAYLVLVCGAAQCLFGVVRRELALPPLGNLGFWIELVGWNLGNALVIVGTLLGHQVIVGAGGALLVVVLARQFGHLRRTQDGPRWLLWLDVVVMTILLFSIPIGLGLAALAAR